MEKSEKRENKEIKNQLLLQLLYGLLTLCVMNVLGSQYHLSRRRSPREAEYGGLSPSLPVVLPKLYSSSSDRELQ
jgi:hypothetical protein